MMLARSGLVTGFVVLAGLASEAFAHQRGDFDILSYSVNGGAGDNGSSADAKLIGSKLSQGGFGLVNLQDDVAFHGDIYSSDNHPQRTTPNGDSGLNVVTNYTWTSYEFVQWDICSLQACANTKGFTFMRVAFQDGIAVDVYNVDADLTGLNSPDQIRARIQQLVWYIKGNSGRRPVIVAGNLNDLWINKGSSLSLLTDSSNNGPALGDLWVQNTQGGGVTPAPGSSVKACTSANPKDMSCENTNKIFWRMGGGVIVQPTYPAPFTYDSSYFVRPDGTPLSDKIPVYAKFNWQV